MKIYGQEFDLLVIVAGVDDQGVGLLRLSVELAVDEDWLPAGVITSDDSAFGWDRVGAGQEQCRGSAEHVPVFC